MTASRAWLPQAILDILLVLVFAAVGRSNHGEAVSLSGVFTTAWPFLAGLVLGWGVSRAWKSPTEIFPSGIMVWLGTLLFGMALRVATGGGFAVAFFIVAALFLGAVLIGSRAIMRRVTAKRTDSPS